MRVLTWNVERCAKGQVRNPRRVEVIRSLKPDIAILTETCEELELGPGYVGFFTEPSPRKPRPGEAVAAVWLREETVEVLDRVSTADLREAVCVAVQSPLGPALVYGSILPYAGYRGPNGESGRWEQTKKYIRWHAKDWESLRSRFPDHHLTTGGDYNQNRDGRRWYGTKEVRAQLTDALEGAGMICLTDEDLRANGKLETRSTVNHICASVPLARQVVYVGAWEGTVDGERLSDHNGVFVDFGTHPRHRVD